MEGIHFFRTEREKSIKIIQERGNKRGAMNLEQATITWQSLARILEPKLYPKMQAIANVYEEAIRQDKDAKKVNPMALWDLHHIRRLDDMGFVESLNGKPGAHAHKHDHDHKHDPDAKAAKQKAFEAISSRLGEAYPRQKGNGVNVKLLHEDQVESSRPALLILWGAVGLVRLRSPSRVLSPWGG